MRAAVQRNSRARGGAEVDSLQRGAGQGNRRRKGVGRKQEVHRRRFRQNLMVLVDHPGIHLRELMRREILFDLFSEIADQRAAEP